MVRAFVRETGLDFLIEPSGSVLKVKFRFDLDISRHAQLADLLALTEHGERDVLLHLGPGVTYIDTYALELLIRFRQRMEKLQRSVAVWVESESIHRMLSTVGVLQLLQVFRDEDEALNALLAQGAACLDRAKNGHST